MSENEKIINDLKQLTKSFMQIDDVIKQKSKELLELKKKRKIIEDALYNILDKIQVDEIRTGIGKLQRTQSTNKVPMNKKFIENVLKNKVGNDQTISEIIKSLNNREKVVRNKIKRTGETNSTLSLEI